ncbi:MAG TPA: hypothetical protein VF540_07865, partial [Segetibacter sp.]
MKKPVIVSLLLIIASALFVKVYSQGASTERWSKHEARKWYKKKEWLTNVPLSPSEPLNVQEFATQYHRNKVYWDKALEFLKTQDLHKIAKGK